MTRDPRPTAGDSGGHGRVTSRQVAAAAGVSQATVSNVINRPDVVAPETRERVLAAIGELGFVLNEAARQLRAGHSATLGICVPDISNPFWAEVTQGAESAAADQGFVLVICSSDQSVDKEGRLLHVLEAQRVAGVLTSPATSDLSPLLNLAERGTPVVLLDQRDPTRRLPFVAVDDLFGARCVGEHLFRLGHRRVAVVNGPHSVPWCAERWEGMRQAAHQQGLDPDRALVELTVPELKAAHGERAVPALLEGERPTAVFCTNDLVALGVLRGLTQHGLAVPHDISLVGYDDDEFAELLSPPLTTVRQEPFHLGHSAVELLLQTGADLGGSAERRGQPGLVLPPKLVVRESTARVRRLPGASSGG